VSVLRGVWRSPSGRLGLVLVGLVVVTVLVSFVWVPHDPLRPVPSERWLGPSADHWFGTGGDGKDLFSGVLVGSRVSLLVGVASGIVAGLVGVTLGVLSAVMPRLVGESLAYLIDVLIAIPTLVLALVLLGLFGGSLFTVSLALGVGAGFALGRIMRAESLRVLTQDYIMASAASGTSTVRMVRRHLLPNIAPIAVIQVTLVAGLAIIAEASLAFLGLTSLSRPSWGRTLRDLQSAVTVHPWHVVAPGLALVVAALGFNLLGDGLRDAIDPRLRAFPGHAGRGAGSLRWRSVLAFPGHAGRRAGSLRWRSARLRGRASGRSLRSLDSGADG
jgi:peptide/nickel transport system permease protein